MSIKSVKSTIADAMTTKSPWEEKNVNSGEASKIIRRGD
jgi:hypothetical protein